MKFYGNHESMLLKLQMNLKPCPFCGNKNLNCGGNKYGGYIICYECDLSFKAYDGIVKLEELAETLDFNKIGRSQPKFDDEDLKKFNTKLIHTLPYENLRDSFGVSKDFWDNKTQLKKNKNNHLFMVV